MKEMSVLCSSISAKLPRRFTFPDEEFSAAAFRFEISGGGVSSCFKGLNWLAQTLATIYNLACPSKYSLLSELIWIQQVLEMGKRPFDLGRVLGLSVVLLNCFLC